MYINIYIYKYIHMFVCAACFYAINYLVGLGESKTTGLPNLLEFQ